jgi:hypothetical protein
LNQIYGEYHKAKAIKDAEREKLNTPMTIVRDDDSDNDDDIPELNQNIVSDDESSDEEDYRKDSEVETDGLEEREDFEGEMDGYEEGESEIKTPRTNPKLRKELKNLETFYNPTNPKLLKELRNMDTFYNPTMTVDKTGREESETARLLIDVAKVSDNQRDDATKQQPFEEPRLFNKHGIIQMNINAKYGVKQLERNIRI